MSILPDACILPWDGGGLAEAEAARAVRTSLAQRHPSCNDDVRSTAAAGGPQDVHEQRDVNNAEAWPGSAPYFTIRLQSGRLAPALITGVAPLPEQQQPPQHRPRHAVERAGEAARVRPCWEPDNARLACRLCSRQFGPMLRRHHCRYCGWLVCQRCEPAVSILESVHID
eukprot:COSAG01_NODE_3090_length_6601_cov_5.372347_8_plen_170_part_00